MNRITDIRPSPIAGRWYSDEPDRLADSVDRYINHAKLPTLEGEVVGVMAPHAGHIYSGPVAGYSFAAVRGVEAEVVAVVSPMHYPYPQELLTTGHAAYETPLGIIPVDHEALAELDAHLEERLGFGLARVRRDPEHSLEIELPFLQRALKGEFKLLPVMVRAQGQEVTRMLGQALAKTLQSRKALLVASTDLSHMYPQATAEALDAEVLRCVEAFDPAGVLMAEEMGKGFACGRGALAAVLWAAKDLGADTVRVLHHATSGAVTGDLTEVVGYGAAVILRRLRQEEEGH
jgi:AmmeMemoRadiSam system protein B